MFWETLYYLLTYSSVFWNQARGWRRWLLPISLSKHQALKWPLHRPREVSESLIFPLMLTGSSQNNHRSDAHPHMLFRYTWLKPAEYMKRVPHMTCYHVSLTSMDVYIHTLEEQPAIPSQGVCHNGQDWIWDRLSGAERCSYLWTDRRLLKRERECGQDPDRNFAFDEFKHRIFLQIHWRALKR